MKGSHHSSFRPWQWGLLGGLFLLTVLTLSAFIIEAFLDLNGGNPRVFIPSPQMPGEPTPEPAAFSVEKPGRHPADDESIFLKSSAAALPRPMLATPTPFEPEPLTPTASPTQSPTPTASSTPRPPQTPTPALPVQASISGVTGGEQTLLLSCESRSASDLARYYGVNVGELEFQYTLPVSDDPDEGFVGNPNGYLGQIPPFPYGVHAGPTAELLRRFGLNAIARFDMTWFELRAEIAAGRPVMVWVIGQVWTGTPVQYTASNGHTTTVAAFEHTVIVTGYDESTVTVLDGNWVYSRPVKLFLRSWEVLGNMAVTVSPADLSP